MRSILFGAAAFAGLVLLSPDPAAARFPVSPITAPSLIEDVACRVRRVRTVRPGGRVVTRMVRTCTPDRRCRNVRTRTVRPNGSVVIRTVRRCR
jgi:hypothetical protein